MNRNTENTNEGGLAMKGVIPQTETELTLFPRALDKRPVHRNDCPHAGGGHISGNRTKTTSFCGEKSVIVGQYKHVQ